MASMFAPFTISVLKIIEKLPGQFFHRDIVTAVAPDYPTLENRNIYMRVSRCLNSLKKHKWIVCVNEDTHEYTKGKNFPDISKLHVLRHYPSRPVLSPKPEPAPSKLTPGEIRWRAFRETIASTGFQPTSGLYELTNTSENHLR